MKARLLSLAIAASLLPGLAWATPPSPAPTPRPATDVRPADDAEMAKARRELEAAQRDLERASSRLAELSQKLYKHDFEKLLRRPAFERPVIGIVMSGDDGAGVRLAAVTPESPAAKAGLRTGDRLLRVNGQTLGTGEIDARLERARKAIGELEEGSQVRLTYERDGVAKDVTMKAESMPGLAWWRGEGQTPEAIRMTMLPREFKMDIGSISPFAACGPDGEDCLLAPTIEAFRWRGLRLAGLEPKLGSYFGTDHGVLVLTTPSEELAGLEPGDVILKIDGERVEQPQQAMRLMRGKEPGSRIQIEFLREHKSQRLQLEAPKHARFPLLPPPPVPPAPPAPPAPPTPRATPAPHAAPMAPPPPPPVAPPQPPEPPTPPPDERLGVIEKVLSF